MHGKHQKKRTMFVTMFHVLFGTDRRHETHKSIDLRATGLSLFVPFSSVISCKLNRQTLRINLEENSNSTVEETPKFRPGNIVVGLDHSRVDDDIAFA